MNTITITSWNVNGLRSILGKGLDAFLVDHNPSFCCLQETKISADLIAQFERGFTSGHVGYFSCAQKKGYSGVATLANDAANALILDTKTQLHAEWIDLEGRILRTELKGMTIYNIYYPSGTTGEVRQDVKYKFLELLYDYFKEMPKAQRAKAIVCGDFNICHRPIDIHHPKEAEKRQLSGFLLPEREWMDRFVQLGFIDTFRKVHGDVTDRYSWWTYRAGARPKNLGWRIDYVFTGSAFEDRIVSADIFDSVMGSDHCPVTATIQL